MDKFDDVPDMTATGSPVPALANERGAGTFVFDALYRARLFEQTHNRVVVKAYADQQQREEDPWSASDDDEDLQSKLTLDDILQVIADNPDLEITPEEQNLIDRLVASTQ